KLNDALQNAFGQHPNIGDIRGRGLFRALEFVEDRSSKTPFAPERAVHKALKKECFEAGLICYPMGGTIDGRNGDHILLAPPFIMEEAHIDEIVSKLQIAIDRVL
ncbi:aminotransferase class III-fold pyridoxal phosphate-dependent enzyme, partial [Litoreibacter halocynthiae]